MFKVRLKKVVLVAAVGNLLALTGDTTFTWTSATLPKLMSNDTTMNPLNRPLNNSEESWISSILSIGCIIGVIPFGLIAQKIGKKYTLLVLAIPHIIAYVTLAFATEIEWYYFARLLNGLAVSGVYMLLPMYLGEISEDSYRGKLMVSYTTFASCGDLLCYVIGPYLGAVSFNLILAAIPLTFLVIFAFIAVESPYFLVQKNKKEEARKVLESLHSGDSKKIEQELESITNEVLQENSGNLLETLKSRQVIKAFTISMGLFLGQQLSGIAAILSYTQLIFDSAGSTVSPQVSSIIVGLSLLLGSFGAPLIVDKKGRRFLLIMSSCGMIISESCLGAFLYLQDQDYDVSSIDWLPIVCLVVYILFYNMGYAPLPQSITSEILPTNIKCQVATASNLMSWALSFLMVMFFLPLNNTIGRGQTFWMFAGFSVGILVFVISFVPETKGKSLQEIQKMLSR